MFARFVLWACLACLLVHHSKPIQYSALPLDLHEADCALILGGDKSSLYDYATNLLRGNFGYSGGGTNCITYDAINQAYLDARKRIHVEVPPVEREWKTEEIAKVGELLLDITVQLARAYDISLEELDALEDVDTSKTLIQEVCPPYLSTVECHPGKYRRLDGLCNNIDNPSWGATMTPFTRLVRPQFADGLNAPRQSVLGQSLPLPRVVSRTMHPDDGYHDHAGTVMVIAWGQFMDHDFTLTATPLDPRNKNDPEECCNRPPHKKHPYCLEIVVPDDDYFYRGFKVKCMDFVRSFPSVRPGCRLGSKTPYNTLTGVIDGNTVYGVNDEFGRHLRSGYNGELRMNPLFKQYGLKDLLPPKLDIPEEGCTRANSSEFCFEAGDIRVNEQLVLTCMHTLMAREHNRVAQGLARVNPHWDDETLYQIRVNEQLVLTCMHTLMAREHNRVAQGLARVNPHWDDETLYQEARRIVVAEIQHITFNEFLPIILGKDVMTKFDLMLPKEGYWDGYDSNVNPNIIAAFSAAAFRFGHSLLPTAIERWSKAHKFISSKRLSLLIRRPYDLYRAGVLDEYLMGLMNQVAQAMDDSITQEVTNHLLKKPGSRFGLDLVSFNMQRGREFGVPGYNEYRKFCGLPVAETFDDLFGSMPNSTVYRYASIYDHPDDIDLWSGGVSERPLPGSMLGPTFGCIIATQLSFVRRGDRFWYELPNQPSSFTPEQLQEIRKIKLSRVMCDNTDLIDTIQIYPMVLPDHEINPRVPCKAGIIPSMDLSKWAEYPSPSTYNKTQIKFPSNNEEGNIGNTCFNVTTCTPNITIEPELVSNTTEPVIPVHLTNLKLNKNMTIVMTSPVLFVKPKTNKKETKSKTKRNRRSPKVDRNSVRFNILKATSVGEDIVKLALENPAKKIQQIENRKSDDTFSIFGPSNSAGNHPIFSSDFIMGGVSKDHNPLGNFPIVDANYDYGDYGGDSRSEDINNEDERYSGEDEPSGSFEDSGDNLNDGVTGGRNNEAGDEDDDEEEEEEEDVVREPKMIVLYKGGDSRDLQPLFEQALTQGDVQARYLKEPLAGPGATRGFNHNFQVIRGMPVGNLVGTNPRFPIVGGFNTSVIHAILQTGQLPSSLTGSNGSTIGVIPVAPADELGGAPVAGHVIASAYPPPYGRGRHVRPVIVQSPRPLPVPPRPAYGYPRIVRRPSGVYAPPSQRLMYLSGSTRYMFPVTGGRKYIIRPRSSVRVIRPVVTSPRNRVTIRILQKRSTESQKAYTNYKSDYQEREDNSYDAEVGHNPKRDTQSYNKNMDQRSNQTIPTIKKKLKSYKRAKPRNSSRNNKRSRKTKQSKVNHNQYNGEQNTRRQTNKEPDTITSKYPEDSTEYGQAQREYETSQQRNLQPEPRGPLKYTNTKKEGNKEQYRSSALRNIADRVKQFSRNGPVENGEEPVSYNKFWSLEYSSPYYQR